MALQFRNETGELEDLLTADEAATKLGLSGSTIGMHLRKGTLKSIQLGKRKYVRASTIDRIACGLVPLPAIGHAMRRASITPRSTK